MAHREILARRSYVGASRGKRSFSGWNTNSHDADAAILDELPVLRDRCRDSYRNNPIAAGSLHTKVTNVVGTGLRLQARLDRSALGLTEENADALERKIESEWRLFAENQECDAERTLTFFELQDAIFRSSLESGDVFVLMSFFYRPGSPYGLKLQVVEADRVDNPDHKTDVPSLAGGVEKDQYGAPIAYHVRSSHPGGLGIANSDDWRRIPAFGTITGRRNVLHLYRKLRPGQTRGVPDLAPVLDMLRSLGKYSEYELQAALVNSIFAAFTYTEDGMGIGGNTATGMGSTSDGKNVEMGSGNIIDLTPGEKVIFSPPSRPNPAFASFVDAMLEQVGVALELPHDVLRQRYNASYSASRAALLEAWKMYKSRRKWLADKLCRPVYEAWFTEAVALGRIPAPGFLSGDFAIRQAYLGSDWVGPSQGALDPLKEAKAVTERIDQETMTRSDAAAEYGMDWERIHPQRAKEERMRREDETITNPPPVAAAEPEKTDTQSGDNNGD